MWQLPAWSSQLFETCGASELADLGVNTVGGVPPPPASCTSDLQNPLLLLLVHLIWVGACAMPAFYPLNAKHLLNVWHTDEFKWAGQKHTHVSLVEQRVAGGKMDGACI